MEYKRYGEEKMIFDAVLKKVCKDKWMNIEKVFHVESLGSDSLEKKGLCGVSRWEQKMCKN